MIDYDVSNELQYQESGRVQDMRPLVGFLNDLLREHLPADVVENLVRENEDEEDGFTFTNGWLAEYAQHLADRLGVPEILEEDIEKAKEIETQATAVEEIIRHAAQLVGIAVDEAGELNTAQLELVALYLHNLVENKNGAA